MSKRLRCFVIMPYSENSDMVFSKVIVPTLQSVPDHNVIALRADQMGPRALTLKAHVEETIRSADFIIADVTGFNPNVMYELGYAAAREIPVVLIGESSLEPRPVGLSDALVFNYEEANILAFKEVLLKTIQDLGRRIEKRQLLAGYESSYKITCYKSAGLFDFSKAITSAERIIDIVETSLSFVAANYIDDLRNTLKAKKKLRVRILTLDPESDLAARRARQLGMPAYEYRMELRQSIQKLYKACQEFESKFSLRLCDESPLQTMFRFDDTIIIAIVTSSRRTEANMHFVLDANRAGVTESFISDFQFMWGRSIEIRHVSG